MLWKLFARNKVYAKNKGWSQLDQTQKGSSSVTRVTSIVEDKKSDLKTAISPSSYWQWLINFSKDTRNNGRYNVYNTTTKQLIAESVDIVYLSEENSDKFPIGIRIQLEKDAGISETEKYRRYYINANGDKVSREYTRPISWFTKDGIAIITKDDLKREFIDINFSVMSVDWISSFDSIKTPVKNPDIRIYLVETNGKFFILKANLEKLFDTAFSNKDKIDIIYKEWVKDWPRQNFIVIEKEWKELEFYDFNGKKVNEDDHKELRYLYWKFKSDTNFEVL